MERARAGVVVMAFGSMGLGMSAKVARHFVHAFAAFPHHQFVVRRSSEWEERVYAEAGLPNVHLLPWVDQRGLLCEQFFQDELRNKSSPIF